MHGRQMYECSMPRTFYTRMSCACLLHKSWLEQFRVQLLMPYPRDVRVLRQMEEMGTVVQMRLTLHYQLMSASTWLESSNSSLRVLHCANHNQSHSGLFRCVASVCFVSFCTHLHRMGVKAIVSSSFFFNSVQRGQKKYHLL